MEKQHQKVYKFIGDSGHGCSKITASINWTNNVWSEPWEQMFTLTELTYINRYEA